MDLRVYLALLLFAATVLVLWAFGLILAPFAVPIAWAMCFLTVTSGLYRRLAKATGKPRLAAFVMTFGVAVAVVGPLVLVVSSLAREAASLSSTAHAAVAHPEPVPPGPASGPDTTGAPTDFVAADAWDRFFDRNPRLRSWREGLDRWLASFGTNSREIRDQALREIGKPFAKGALGALQGVLWALFGFVVMLATLYFLYRDGGKIRALVVDLSPMPVEQTTRVLDVLRSTAFAAIVGGLATALLQGTIGGIGLAIVGLDAPVFWGFMMAVLSLLPIGGTAFVWLPVGVYFLLEGEAWRGWFILAWGAIVVGGADYIFRPFVMRHAGAGEVHPLLLFFAILSGIGLFGFSGVVFGPLLVAFVIVVVQIFREHFGKRTAPPLPIPPPPA